MASRTDDSSGITICNQVLSVSWLRRPSSQSVCLVVPGASDVRSQEVHELRPNRESTACTRGYVRPLPSMANQLAVLVRGYMRSPVLLAIWSVKLRAVTHLPCPTSSRTRLSTATSTPLARFVSPGCKTVGRLCARLGVGVGLGMSVGVGVGGIAVGSRVAITTRVTSAVTALVTSAVTTLVTSTGAVVGIWVGSATVGGVAVLASAF